MPDIEALGWETKAWERERNRLGASVDWCFTTEGTKLRSLYPPTDE